MALGMTRLEAVNRMLAVIGQGNVAALSSSGSWPSKTYNDDDAGEAERHLDFVCREVLAQGWPGNVDKCKTYTANGSGQIVLTADRVLAVRGAGNDQHRKFTIRGDNLYDMVTNTDVVATPTTGTVQLDVIRDFTFEDLPSDLKNVIVAKAEQRFRDLKKPNELLHNFWNDLVVQAEARADRLEPGAEWNTRPILPQLRGQGQQ